MSGEADDLIDRAIAKHVQRTKQEVEGQRLNGLASTAKDDQRAAFLEDFSVKCRNVIEPRLALVEQGLERARSASALSNDGAAAQRLASAQVEQDDDRIELSVSRGENSQVLSFQADPHGRVIRVVSSTKESVNTVLNLDQVTDEIIGGMVAAFLEPALSAL